MPKRSYRMVARAAAAEGTRRRILAAAVVLFASHDPDQITLEAIASRAGVTLQTVLRRFGSKDQIFSAAAAARSAEIQRARQVERAGDVPVAVHALAASYENTLELSWRMLRLETQHPILHEILVRARAAHRDWLVRTFGKLLPTPRAARTRALDRLFAATDFYLWKLLRTDLGRSVAEAEACMRDLVEAVVTRLGRARPR